MKAWRDLFPNHILDRGWDYYESGNICEVQTTTDGFKAEVEGTQDYHVRIRLQENRIVDLSCDCPYADGGSYCKHMAAVLYAVESDWEDGEEDISDRIKGAKKELKDLIEGIPAEEAKQLLFELAWNDNALKNRILTQYAPVTLQQIVRLKNQVDEIGYKYSDRYGFVDYYQASAYMNALCVFLGDCIPVLMKKGHHMDAFEIVNCVFHEVGNRDMDDSDGTSEVIGDMCYEYWQEILEVCSEEEEKELMQWFMEHRENYVIDYMEDYIYDFLSNEFEDEELLRLKMKDLDQKIEIMKEKSESGQTYSAYYGWVSNILERIQIMEKLNYTQEEIKNYRNQFRRFHEIRELEIAEYIEAQDYENAIRVLKESKVLDKNHKGLLNNYSKQLMELYKKANKQVEYKDELLKYIFEEGFLNIEHIMQLKAVCEQEEWEAYRERLLAAEISEQVKWELLEKEGLYRRLFEKVTENSSIYVLDKYEAVLKKHFPEEVRDVYIRYVNAAMYRASARNLYRDAVEYLKKIRTYPEGERLAQEIADSWKREYKRRTAMVEELKNAGF